MSDNVQIPIQPRVIKTIGPFRAPSCRCTPLVLALCVCLSGLVLAAIGACICGFMWHDITPKALGLALIILGVIMMCTGFGLFVFDGFVRRKKFQESDFSLSERPSSNEQQQANSRGWIAPPAYDDVVQENIRFRDDATNSNNNNPRNNDRVSYFTAVRSAKVTSTTEV
ncbi:hypothetical protein T07_11245 [Trichinella nelsoni]|uniref:Uncharacterized protein n=3 Tax=Trichinella TaxID=6333 RepID=A0A0V1L2H9_9BILA|nr:hypothetical protein T07_11245 [Trichinella nelsoni]KRX53004.1 hypothetical protein T09_48 [Trichinella sp. T9]KRX70562.1 hypothetical protein T06_3398 [Trichinella sp. T6]KRY56302.1 hypothetical protein T03_9791 [Trichinella britovi]KRZ53755.1 hypothetical protein T02_6287 [Trichinella nativa]KRZ83213.1 hypothetical protein T08_14978 [Trichinella sp. T8]